MKGINKKQKRDEDGKIKYKMIPHLISRGFFTSTETYKTIIQCFTTCTSHPKF
jgi:hypothetical protein